MYYTYTLENPQGRLYVGQTSDIGKRLLRHNSNKVTSTKNRGPWTLIFQQEFATRAEAVAFERYLKSLKNSKYIKEYIIG